MSDDLQWTRTGKITMRSEPWLIIRYPAHYAALYGPPGDREVLGFYQSAKGAQRACEKHRQKNAREPKL